MLRSSEPSEPKYIVLFFGSLDGYRNGRGMFLILADVLYQLF
jgi:hypothetical protein